MVDPGGTPRGIVSGSVLRIRDESVSGQKLDMRSVPRISVRGGRGNHGDTAGVNDIHDHSLLVGHKGLHNLDSAVRKSDSCGLGAIARCLVDGCSLVLIPIVVE